MAKSETRRASNRAHDARRRGSQPWRAWYKDARWVHGRIAHLMAHPLCVMCVASGTTTAATVVDHRTPHRGEAALFFDVTNWQSLCDRCHDIRKQREEARGYADTLDADGWPQDPRHPANTHHARAVARREGIVAPQGGAQSLGPLDAGPAADLRAQRRVIPKRGQTDVG